MGHLVDILPIWRDWTDDVTGGLIVVGHVLAEENPDDVLTALTSFLLRDAMDS